MATLALAQLWRVGAWHLHPAALLTFDEGLSPGALAPDLAALSGPQEMHLSFGGRQSFLVFGTDGCEPCAELVRVAPTHPATRHMRLVYVSDTGGAEADPDVLCHWEAYRFHDERSARADWRAPVSPYFHVIGDDGRVLDKGIANKAEHLDRLLRLAPPSLRPLQETFGR